ncbi:hypothetical protein SteCoe_20378 [Stentor coeruleus]|uniref:Major facilitator superfamily (MFS) profile domain-containing protein n=1 Tax=Stentor coeruleus TaxID=5963 RepID=A0A1R2BS38_9CILI|nr:hypothetical protein SteCoe_20378 [Stentor coeruleus]
MKSPEEHPLIEETYEPLGSFELYKKSFSDLLKAPRDLWLLFIIKFCLYGSFSTFLAALSIYITEVKDFSDLYLCLAFAAIGGPCLIFFIFFGSFNDRYGIRYTLILGSLTACLPFVVIAIYDDLLVSALIVMLPGAFSISLIASSLEVGIKYYTQPHYRTLALSLYSVLSYVSLIIGGILIEVLMVTGGKDFDTFRIIFIYCAINCVIALVLSCFLRQLDFSSFEELEVTTTRAQQKSTWEFVREFIITKKFWRLFSVLLIVLIIKSITFQQAIALPLYMSRDLGSDKHYGLMIIINQVLLIIFLPIFTYSIYYFSAYEIFIIGGTIGILAVLPLMFGASYYTIISYILISSIAESMYNPRLLEYVFEVSHKGKEGMIVSLAGIITIIIMVCSGMMGGGLLNEFCSAEGETKCWLMWLIFAAVPLPGLLTLIFAKTCIEEPPFESQPYLSWVKEAKHT